MLLHRILAALIPVFALNPVACSTVAIATRPVTVEEADTLSDTLGGRHADVIVATVQGPESRHGTIDALDIGSLQLTAADGRPERISFGNTQSIRFNDHGKGALRGLTAGAISGALAGFVAGAILGGICMSSETPCHDNSLSVGGAGALAGALVFGAIGAGIGAIVGHPTTLTF